MGLIKKGATLLVLLLVMTGCKSVGEISAKSAPVDSSVHLKKITFSSAENGTVVKVYASKHFQYTSYKLSDPLRIAVEFLNSTPDFVAKRMKVNDKNISHISVVKFPKVNSVRVELELYEDLPFRVKVEKRHLRVYISNVTENKFSAKTERSRVNDKNLKSDFSLNKDIEQNDIIEKNRKLSLELLEAKENIASLEEKNSLLKTQAEEAQKQLDATNSMATTQNARILFMEKELSKINTKLAVGTAIPSTVVVPVPVPSVTSNAKEAKIDSSKEDSSIDVEIKDVVNGWISAWNQEDIKKYAGYYSYNFRSGEQDKMAYIMRKGNIFSGKGQPSIEAKLLEVTSNGKTATAFFLQVYTSATMKSRGWKTLSLTKESNGWKIVSETWSRRK